MGNKIFSFISKPIRDFNIENRAHNAIIRNKPLPAPKYEAEKLAYEKIKCDYPNALETSLKKNVELEERLKNIYVTSFDDNPIVLKETPDKPLPLNRTTVPFFEFGYKEPDDKSRIAGKVSIKQALEFITNHQSDPKICSVQFISDKYLIPEETVADILHYFRVYQIYDPISKPNKYAVFAGPSFPRIKIEVKKKLKPPKETQTNVKEISEDGKKNL